ncbi:MAG: metal ABC transporter substrate-binding protein [Parcubacteria group bacterium]
MPSIFKNSSDKIIFIGTIVFFAVIAIFVFLNPFSERTKVNAPAEKLKIATTVIPVESLAREIGGDKVTLTLIVPEGQSPHTFEPTPETMKNVSGAASVFKIGIIDDWASDVASSFNIPVFYVGEGTDLITNEGIDPHYWLSIKNGKIIAQNIAEEFTRLDKENADYYAANLTAFVKKADETDTEIKETLSGIKNRNIITFHDAWEYFARDYDLNVVAVYEPSPGKEPLPQDVKSLIDKAKEYDIGTFFSEIQYSSAPLRAIGEDEGIKIVPLNPLETKGAYLDTILENAKTIRDALK